MHVYMLTPETFQTVIGIAVSLHKYTAIPACKIFNVTLKFLVHEMSSAPLACVIRYNVRFKLGDTLAKDGGSICSQ